MPNDNRSMNEKHVQEFWAVLKKKKRAPTQNPHSTEQLGNKKASDIQMLK